MQHPSRRQWAAAALLYPAIQCMAATDVPDEQEYLQELPVVLSASRLKQPLSETPNAMTVIDRKMIVASGFRNLPDAFKLVPGMYVSYYTQQQAIVSYHGALSQDAPGMQVLVDGRSVYMPPFNIVDWALLPITLDDVERIEIIRGPAAASYGENSTHGVINIITRDAGAFDGASLSHTRGNKGVSDATAQFGRRGEKLDYRMTLAYRADNGYDNLIIPPNNLPIGAGSTLLNNSYDNNQARLVNYRAAWHPNAVDNVEVQLGFNRDVQGVGYWDSSLDKQHDMTAYENFQQLEWARRSDSASEFSLRYYHIHHRTSENYQLGANRVSTSMKTDRHEIELLHTLQTSPANRLVYGAGYRRDEVVGHSGYPPAAPGSFPTSFSFNEYRIFANDEWRASEKALLNAGGMLENDAMDNRTFSPRLSLNYHFTPRHTVRLGASIAYRTPSLGERNVNGANQYQLGYKYQPGPAVASPGLLPEKVLSREIGYLGEFASTTLDLRVYNDQYGRLMYPSGAIFKNGMSAHYTGIEASLRHSFADSGELTLNLSSAMANSNFATLTPGQPDWLALSIPRNSASLLYSRQVFGNAAFSTAYYLQTPSQGFDRGPTDYQPTQHRTDVRLAFPFNAPGGLKGEFVGVVQNLFNTDYTEYVANNLFNRRAYFTVTLRQ